MSWSVLVFKQGSPQSALYRLNILSIFRTHDRNPTILLSLVLASLWARRFKNTVNITCFHLRGEGVNPGKWVPSVLPRHLRRLPGTGTTQPVSTPESLMLSRDPRAPCRDSKGPHLASSRDTGILKSGLADDDPAPLTHPTPASSGLNEATETHGPHSP